MQPHAGYREFALLFAALLLAGSCHSIPCRLIYREHGGWRHRLREYNSPNVVTNCYSEQGGYLLPVFKILLHMFGLGGATVTLAFLAPHLEPMT